MKIFLVILIIIVILFFLFRKKGTDTSIIPPSKQTDEPPTIEDDDTEKWRTLTHTKLFHRKTFIKGKLIAKYYGELDYVKDAEGFVKEKYFDFTLYDAEIKDSAFRKNNEGAFPEFKSKELFPGNIQPTPLPCKISYNNISGDFEIKLYDVKLANIDFNRHRALHQEEDNEVFGTVEADITGYILEEFTEEYEEKIKIEPEEIEISPRVPIAQVPFICKTSDRTGKTKTEGNYSWEEFWYSDRKTTYWGNPKFIGRTEIGCLSSIWQLLGLLLGLLFLIAIGPKGIVALLIIVGIGLLIAYFSDIFKWLFRIAGIIILLFAIFWFISALQNQKPTAPKPFAKDEEKEIKKIEKDKINPVDSLIVHHRIWKDYEGNQYEGDIWVRLNDFRQSNSFKNQLSPHGNSLLAYDRLLFDLKNQDSSKLYGVYKLLDSIRTANNLTSKSFAEVVVSFVQDIPYAIVLDNACDANLYNDYFTKSYLLNNQGECEGNQKFGINTPVEFMGTLKGDCDTRTLLLYTMLSHYGYDVALLSSEVYSHSILAINLPLAGKSIRANGKQYFVWETTSPNIRAGLLSEEISDFNNWRISLISKP
jgi:hypothetical protein